METKNWIILFFLAAIWGSAFMFIKVATPEFGPLLLVNSRLYLAGFIFIPFLLQKKYRKLFRSHFPGILVLSVSNNALPFFLFSYASLGADSNILAILNGTTAFMTTLLALIWIGEKINFFQVVGLICGFLGILILVNPVNSSTTIMAGLSCVLGAFCYSFSGVFIQKVGKNLNTFVLIGWSLFFGALIMTPITLNYLPEVMPSQLGILSMLWLGVVSTGIAYIAYVRLIKNIGAIKTSSVTYLIPVFGIIWGNVFLSEEITFLILIGFIFIMLGLYLINRKTI